MMTAQEWITKRLHLVDGWCKADAAQMIYDLIKPMKKPFAGVEIGVCGGRSLIPAALAVRDGPGSGKIYGIDPYTVEAAIEFETNPETIAWWQTKATPARSKLQALREIKIADVGNVCELLFTTAHTISGQFTRLDYLHVDGNHNQPAVKRDLDHYLPKVVSGGLIRLDNVDWPGVEAEADRVRNVSDFVDGDGTFEIWRKR